MTECGGGLEQREGERTKGAREREGYSEGEDGEKRGEEGERMPGESGCKPPPHPAVAAPANTLVFLTPPRM